jgi:hypothetical protein
MLENSKLNTRYISWKYKALNPKPGKILHAIFPHPVDLSGSAGDVCCYNYFPAQTRVHFCFATISSVRMRRALSWSHVPSLSYRSRADWAVVKEAAAKKTNKHSCL